MPPKSAGSVAPELLADLAAAARILAAEGVVDGFGHVSMRHPSSSDRYLMSRSKAPALKSKERNERLRKDSTQKIINQSWKAGEGGLI